MAKQPKNGNGKALTDPDISLTSLLTLYWRSSAKKYAYFILVVVLVMTVSLVGLDVVFNLWYKHFYNALQAYDRPSVIDLLIVFFFIAGVYIVVAVYRFFISQVFGIHWRKWLTDQFVGRWLKNKSYYLIENFYEKTDNPDQRIQQDIGVLVKYSIDLTIGIVAAITTFIGFIAVLWALSGTITIPLGPLGTFQVSGYLVWVAVIYAFAGTYLTYKIGNKLVPLNFEQQRLEASYRFAAIDVRNHAEHVALYRGEQHQKVILNGLFDKVLWNYYLIIVREKLLLWFTAGYNQLSVAIPLIVALPNYFAKVFLLGGLIQTLQAFGKVQDSLSFIINSYTTIAEWQAVAKRLTTFVQQMYKAEEAAARENKLEWREHAENTIEVAGVEIKTPRGDELLRDVNYIFQHGSHYLIKGDSGIGKSTFIRTVAGIWPYAAGQIVMPVNQKMMYVPQKPYMPIGTLAEAILFPDKHQPELESRLKDVLVACNLERFVERLYETASWAEQMSPGEQQRVAFARILLHKPDWVFMDESTSMLDVANEKHLYELVKKELPRCSIISVGHRPTIDVHHDHIIDMTQFAAH